MTRADRLLILLLLAGLPWLYWYFWSSEQGQQLSILVAGQAPEILPLYANQDVHIEGVLGESIIRIENGRARFIHSPCSNKVCIQQGWIDKTGEIAACLPNRVSIRVLGDEGRFDAVNF